MGLNIQLVLPCRDSATPFLGDPGYQTQFNQGRSSCAQNSSSLQAQKKVVPPSSNRIKKLGRDAGSFCVTARDGCQHGAKAMSDPPPWLPTAAHPGLAGRPITPWFLVVRRGEARPPPGPESLTCSEHREPHETLAGILSRRFTRTNQTVSAWPSVSARWMSRLATPRPGLSGEDQRLSLSIA